jgi:hydrogenase maturation protein HypF
MAATTEQAIQRQRICVQGIVQGVGFRPFVYGQAVRLGLVGYVLNDSLGVTIEIEGPTAALADFQRSLREDPPPLARIDEIAAELIPLRSESAFTIAHSKAGTEKTALISPDTATCDDCLRELFDSADRRYGYPFINCTNCGPRFTIVQDVPYDRDKTTMRVFPMCPDCRAEYENPLDRRFHAQPNACPACGPQVELLITSDGNHGHDTTCVGADLSRPSVGQGNQQANDPCIPHAAPRRDKSAPTQRQDSHAPHDGTPDPILDAARLLANGSILAIKGLGGYHLACDALNAEAVQRLRSRKQREAKPFAVMVADLETARKLCEMSEDEAALLQSRRRPIVLLRQRSDCQVAAGVSPAYSTLGIMLPYTPLHHVLLHAFTQVSAPEKIAALVMTSGNISDEPIAYRDDDAMTRLAPIVDGFLTHNRDIHMRCDDSVMRVCTDGEQFFRRSRGYAPEPIPLAFDLPVPLLACGAHLKNTFCLGKGRQAFISHHIGDLENLETLTSLREGIEHFQRLFDIKPQAIAYDLHPEYLATKYALDADIPEKIGVQHHHAHIASVIAEHGLTEPVIGVAADGTGYGTDGAIWGCEIMIADLLAFQRIMHLAYVPLPGGDHAVRQPWRVAATYLAQAYDDNDEFLALDIPFVNDLDRSKWHVLSQMISKKLNSPLASSLGRLFDAVAALIGLRGSVVYEGQAAIELEQLASTYKGRLESYPFSIEKDHTPAKLDVLPMMRAIVSDIQHNVPMACIAARFHYTIAGLLASACREVREQNGLNIVALSGGVFQNRLLLEQLLSRLKAMSFQVYINHRIPPNDGGVSLGQIAIVSARLRSTGNNNM